MAQLLLSMSSLLPYEHGFSKYFLKRFPVYECSAISWGLQRPEDVIGSLGMELMMVVSQKSKAYFMKNKKSHLNMHTGDERRDHHLYMLRVN